MTVLLVSATQDEAMRPTDLPALSGVTWRTLVTGVAIVNTTYELTRYLARDPVHLVINTGVCGSFSPYRPLGTMVHVREEIFSDLGARDRHGNFLTLTDLGFPLLHRNGEPIYNVLPNPNRLDTFFEPLERPVENVRGLTVHTVHGDQPSIIETQRTWEPDVESMEGAALAYVCQRADIPYFEFRTVSNHVAPRDTTRWNVPLACQTLRDGVGAILRGLKSDR